MWLRIDPPGGSTELFELPDPGVWPDECAVAIAAARSRYPIPDNNTDRCLIGAPGAWGVTVTSEVPDDLDAVRHTGQWWEA